MLPGTYSPARGSQTLSSVGDEKLRDFHVWWRHAQICSREWLLSGIALYLSWALFSLGWLQPQAGTALPRQDGPSSSRLKSSQLATSTEREHFFPRSSSRSLRADFSLALAGITCPFRTNPGAQGIEYADWPGLGHMISMSAHPNHRYWSRGVVPFS